AVAVAVGVGATAILDRPRLARALVGGVEHAVLVVVGIRAAVGVLEPVDVLRLIDAGVERVGQPVAVLVRHLVGAAVVVLEAVHGLRLGLAAVDVVHDAVAVGVLRLRAAVRRLAL